MNTQLFRLATRPDWQLVEATDQIEAPRISTEQSAEDFVEATGRRYSLTDLTGGSGLDFKHRPNQDPLDSTRFWDSKNVDVFSTKRGDVYEVNLLHETELVRAVTVAQLNHSMAAVIGSTLFVADNQDVVKITGVASVSPTETVEAPEAGGTPGTVQSLAVLGGELYAVVNGEGTQRRDTGGTWANWSTLEPLEMWSVKARLVGAVALGAPGYETELYEIAAAAGSTLLLTTARGTAFTDIADVGLAIAAATNTGVVYFLYDDAGTLTPAGQYQFEGAEYPVSIIATQGQILIGTAEPTAAGGLTGRLYTATLETGNGLFTFSDVRLIREWLSDTVARDRAPWALAETRDSVYCFIPEIANADGGYLWRYYLPTGGIARDLEIPATWLSASQGVANGLVAVDDRLVVHTVGIGVWRELATYADSGYIIGPLADFFTALDKQWVSARLTGRLPGSGAKLSVYQTTDPTALDDPDSGLWTQILTTSGDSDLITAITGTRSRWHAVKIVLEASSDNTLSPGFRSISVRGIPIVTPDVQVRVPINVSDHVELPGRRRLHVKDRGEAVYQALVALEGTFVTLELYDPAATFRGRVERVETPVPLPRARRGSVTLVSYVTIKGSRVLSSTATTGTGPFGGTIFAATVFGGGP